MHGGPNSLKRSGQNPPVVGNRHRLGPAGRAELGHDPRQVHAHRLLADVKLLADLTVGAPQRHPLQHIALPAGQQVDRLTLRRAGQIDPGPPREIGKRQVALYPFAALFNFTGQPSLSLPLGMSAQGLPIGMMFTGRYADEATLYRLAGQLEKEMPWAQRRPQVWA